MAVDREVPGLSALSEKCMALELASHNILVNEIAPGYVNGAVFNGVFGADVE
jgi:NAD(P)-dependent dehydrogenase (short-subunit alcohol dehydrogenase family)